MEESEVIDVSNPKEVLKAIAEARIRFAEQVVAMGCRIDEEMSERHERWIDEYRKHPYTQFATAFILMLNDTLDNMSQGVLNGHTKKTTLADIELMINPIQPKSTIPSNLVRENRRMVKAKRTEMRNAKLKNTQQ